MILTLTKNRKYMNSKDISSFSTQNPFCWTCCFWSIKTGASTLWCLHQGSTRCRLFVGSATSLAIQPEQSCIPRWCFGCFFSSPATGRFGCTFWYFFSADQGTKLPVTGAGFPSINCTFQLEGWSSTYRWRLLPGFFFEQNHLREFYYRGSSDCT